MSANKKTEKACPACGSPFTYQHDDGTVAVWCANARCPSAAGYDGLRGSLGETPEKLAGLLAAMVENEL